MRARGLFFTPHGEPRLLVPGVLGVLVAFLGALALISFLSRPRTEEARAESLMKSGKPAQSERIFARLLREQPSVPLALRLLEAHEQARLLQKLQKLRDETRQGSGMGLPDAEAPMTDEEIEAVIAELPPDIALVARFSRGLSTRTVAPEVRDKVTEAAAREPPAPWTNHLLGRDAERESKHLEAAELFLREGLAFPERRGDVDLACQIWIALDAWDLLHERLARPDIAAAASPRLKYRVAVHDRDWKAAVRWLPAIWAPRFESTGIVMSAIAALGWAFFCARLGKLGARWRFRLPMYAIAFVLGVASIFPTVFLIAIEEAKLKLVETGDPARDILFFVFGVGLREEAAKLPSVPPPPLPILRKWGDKLDVLVCGAFVGLGFAAEENLNYLAQENLHTGLGRFLTANFFHMALTGTLASALDDFLSDRERNAASFSRTSLFIVAIHGIYDFLLSHEEFGGGYFAMTAFVFLTRMFLGTVDSARRRADRGITPLHAFVLAVAVVTGVSLAYAVVAVGPKAAFLVMGGGLLGEAIIVYVFVRTLRAM